MKNLFALGVMILVFLSCEKDNSTKVELSSDYFPLKVGNYWNFEHVGKYMVSETQMVNGVEYFKIATDYSTTMLYRNHDNKIFTKESSLDNSEVMKFDLTAEVNDTWTYGNGNVTLVNRNATVTIGEMQIDSCLKFNFRNENLIDYGYSIWLAPRIGLIQQTCQECFGSSFVTMKLVKVNINNQETEFK